MKHYYISNPSSAKGFDEITKAEWIAIIGEEPNRSYATKVYRGQITMDEVPEENKATVESIVAAKIARFGEYGDQPVPATELKNMVEEVL